MKNLSDPDKSFEFALIELILFEKHLETLGEEWLKGFKNGVYKVLLILKEEGVINWDIKEIVKLCEDLEVLERKEFEEKKFKPLIQKYFGSVARLIFK